MSRPPETLTSNETTALLFRLTSGPSSSFGKWLDLRNYTIVLLMLDAGLRVGEVCRLTISDLVFQCQPRQAIDLSAEIAEKQCERIIPVTSRLSQAIDKMRLSVWQPLQCPLTHPAFFARDIRKALTTRQIQRIISDISKRFIGREIHPHVLRHTFATRLMRVTSVAVVQQLLGHKHITSTQIYQHPNGDDCKAAIDKLLITPP